MKKKNFLIGIGIVILCLITYLISVILCNDSTIFVMEENNILKDEWIITQHGRNDINLSCYTIYNETKGLIVIDGGWTEDAASVREAVYDMGGHIDAWIITHPHQDHVGAFNLLYSELDDITVDKIYTVDMASPNECIEIAPWDSVDAYNDFLDLNIENLTYLYSGDVLDICGLKFEIFSTYDDNVKKISNDFLNDGSMMFKVTNKEESILFCADVGIGMSDFLMDKWGENLKADYLQMAHHGYGGLKDNFYQAVNPTVTFFDAPDWLMLDTTGKYDNPQNAEFIKSLGSEIYSFNSAPNTIILK